ncbi:helix-turn-helix domain-containing protein [Enterococcus sp. DIV0756]|uniref:helix-turn-helix domain-containing protein n=1 Tax=Enterococcus sp. DIV0756 TaxID=2774636 RepID=UPI003F687162
MGRILLLTKNVLAEEDFQKKLQHLNYEVFSSSSLLARSNFQNGFLQFFNLFYYTILSETISDIELEHILPVLNRSSTIIIRKNDHLSEKQTQDVRMNLWISNESSIEELRETLMESFHEERAASVNERITSYGLEDAKKSNWKYSTSTLSLSGMEKRILKALYLAKGQVISREELCTLTWDGEITDSKMVMLSNAIRKLRIKLDKGGLPKETIRTLWGKGYQLSTRFFEYFEFEDLFDAEECDSLLLQEKENDLA